jgi:c-di-GMP-binding flagellar brake protein YcgR
MGKMPLIEELFRPDTQVQVELTDDDGSKLVYQAKVMSLVLNNLVLMVQENEETLVQIKPGTKMSLICQIENEPEDFVFQTRLIKNDPPLLVVTQPTESLASTRRRYFRLDVRLPFSYFVQDELKGEVTNLSASGLFAMVKPDQQLKVNMDITCQISLPTSSKPLLFVAKIARMQKKGDLQGIGLNFQYSSEDLQSHVTKYLFDYQRGMINLNRRKPNDN